MYEVDYATRNAGRHLMLRAVEKVFGNAGTRMGTMRDGMNLSTSDTSKPVMLTDQASGNMVGNSQAK